MKRNCPTPPGESEAPPIVQTLSGLFGGSETADGVCRIQGARTLGGVGGTKVESLNTDERIRGTSDSLNTVEKIWGVEFARRCLANSASRFRRRRLRNRP